MLVVLKDVCGNLAETLATADLVVLEVGVVGEEADDLVSPVLAVAVVPEWWVSVAFTFVHRLLRFTGPCTVPVPCVTHECVHSRKK